MAVIILSPYPSIRAANNQAVEHMQKSIIKIIDPINVLVVLVLTARRCGVGFPR